MNLRRLGSGHYAGWICVAAIVALSGCGRFFPPLTNTGGGSSGGGTTSGDYVYAGNLGTSPYTIAGFSFANSALNVVSGSPFSVASAGEPTAMTIYGNYLYMSSTSTQALTSYAIASDGSLSNGSGVQVGPAAVKVDTSGKWLIGVDTFLSEAYALGLNSSTGTVTAPLSASTVALPNCSTTNLDSLPPGIAIAANDNYIYVSCGTGGVYTLSFNATNGALTRVNSVLSPANTNGADFGLTANPAGNLLLIAESLAGVRVLTINSTNGTLAEVNGSPFATGNGPTAVLVDSTGSYVYVANRTDGTLSGFLLTNAGALTKISGSPFSTGSGSLPIALAEDKSGAYLAVACNGGSYGLQTFSFSSSTPGALVAFQHATTGSGTTATYSLAATQ